MKCVAVANQLAEEPTYRRGSRCPLNCEPEGMWSWSVPPAVLARRSSPAWRWSPSSRSWTLRTFWKEELHTSSFRFGQFWSSSSSVCDLEQLDNLLLLFTCLALLLSLLHEVKGNTAGIYRRKIDIPSLDLILHYFARFDFIPDLRPLFPPSSLWRHVPPPLVSWQL